MKQFSIILLMFLSVMLNAASKGEDNGKIDIYYKTTWENPLIFLNLNGAGWNNSQGLEMENSDFDIGCKHIQVIGKNVEFYFENGSYIKDNQNNLNYHIEKPGKYIIENGNISEIDNSYISLYLDDIKDSKVFLLNKSKEWQEISLSESKLLKGYFFTKINSSQLQLKVYKTKGKTQEKVYIINNPGSYKIEKETIKTINNQSVVKNIDIAKTAVIKIEKCDRGKNILLNNKNLGCCDKIIL